MYTQHYIIVTMCVHVVQCVYGICNAIEEVECVILLRELNILDFTKYPT